MSIKNVDALTFSTGHEWTSSKKNKQQNNVKLLENSNLWSHQSGSGDLLAPYWFFDVWRKEIFNMKKKLTVTHCFAMIH